MRPGIRALVAFVLLCGAGLAQPLERGAFRLVWKAPADCPTDLEALARIEALLGTRVSELPLPALAARARVTTTSPGRYELVLETFQGEQRFLRTMQAPSCAELTDAGALVLALAIDPTLSERRAHATPAGSSTSDATPAAPAGSSASAPPPPAAPPAEKPADAPATQDRPSAPGTEAERPVRFLLGARAVLDFGSVADVAVGPGIALGVKWGRLEASLDGVWLPTRRTLTVPGKGGDISLAAASLRGCYQALAGSLSALGCAVFELGSLDGEGVGTRIRTHQSGLWAAPGAAVTGRLRLGTRLFLALGAGALIPLQPIDFTLDNVGLVRRVPPLVARGEAGLHAHFD